MVPCVAIFETPQHKKMVELAERQSGLQDASLRLNSVSPDNNSALHIAAMLGHLALAEALINKEPSLVNLPNNSGDYPLHCAARAGHANIVTLLLKDKKCSTLELRSNKLGNTALHEAVQIGNQEMVKALVTELPLMWSVNNRADVSPLYMAAERESVDIVKHWASWSLLESGKQLCMLPCPQPSVRIGCSGPCGQTALHAAVLRSPEITKLILEGKPSLMQEGDTNNNSKPIHYAASHGDLEMVKLLLMYQEGSAAYLRDKNGRSAIHVAAHLGHVDIINILLEKCPGCVEMTDLKGFNFLHIAVDKKRTNVVNYVLSKQTILEELANLPDHNGNTALHLAVLSHNKQIIKLLSANKSVDKHRMNNNGQTPLDLASSRNVPGLAHRMDMIRLHLMSNGSRFHPQRLDNLLNNRPRTNTKEDIERYRATVNNLAVVSTLIATVTFAAAFTLPLRDENDDGISKMISEFTFKVFLIADTIAMVSSVIAAFMLVYTGSLADHDLKLHFLRTAKLLIWISLAGMTLAFGTNIVIMVKSRWLANSICVVSVSALFATFVATHWPSYRIKMVGKQGVAIDMNIIQRMRSVVNYPSPSVERMSSGVNFPSPSVQRMRSGLNFPSPSVERMRSGVNFSSPSVQRMRSGVNFPSPLSGVNFPSPSVQPQSLPEKHV